MVVPYPRDWAPAASLAGDSCFHFNGEYDNGGWTVEPSAPMLPLSEAGPPDYLTRIFLGQRDLSVHRIRLEVGESGRIVVHAIGTDGKSARTDVSDNFTCVGGRIRFSEGGGVAGGGLVAVGGSSWSIISKATDGSLVVETMMWAAGVAMVAPVAMVGRTWARFPASDPSPKPVGAAPAVDPYAWPTDAAEHSPPLVLRSTELEYSRLFRETVAAVTHKVDCAEELGAAVVAALPRVRATLEAVPAAQVVEDEVRRGLAATKAKVERTNVMSRPADRVAAAQAIGARSQTAQVIVADVKVRFGQVVQATCAVKLVASAEVRVQPSSRPEAAVPLYDVWAVAERVPVEQWAAHPEVATEELTRLLRQVGAELARSYLVHSRCAQAGC